MPSRKRSIHLVEGGHDEDDTMAQALHRIRNMWQFANFCQWIYIFGKAANIDESIDIEEIETECLKPNPMVLTEIALALLKFLSSQRGLTCEILDDQLRKQYLSRDAKYNPFGDAETPERFRDLDIFTKIRVLQQLTQWIMIHPERLRDKMDEQRDNEQTTWRIEPYGWDSQDRTYFVLDDNRVYRLSQPAPSRVLSSKKNSQNRARNQSHKRRRMASATNNQLSHREELDSAAAECKYEETGDMVWECIAVSLHELRAFLDTLAKTRDGNEKVLRKQLEVHLLPILEKQEESRKRKEGQRERELLNLAKMANAKRSSRIAGKAEQQRQQVLKTEEEERDREVEASNRREQSIRFKLEQERHARMMSRDHRLQERKIRRHQHEEELAQLSEDSRSRSAGLERISERRLLADIERTQQALKELQQEEEDWVFDCVCGVVGQVDDGTHSVACEQCSVWQHSRCIDVREDEADHPDFHFICASCSRPDDVLSAKVKKKTIVLKVHHAGVSEEKYIRPTSITADLSPKTIPPQTASPQLSDPTPKSDKEHNHEDAQDTGNVRPTTDTELTSSQLQPIMAEEAQSSRTRPSPQHPHSDEQLHYRPIQTIDSVRAEISHDLACISPSQHAAHHPVSAGPSVAVDQFQKPGPPEQLSSPGDHRKRIASGHTPTEKESTDGDVAL